MKLLIQVPKCLNWLFVDKADEHNFQRAALTGEAKTSKRWGNKLASIELVTTYSVSDDKDHVNGR